MTKISVVSLPLRSVCLAAALHRTHHEIHEIASSINRNDRLDTDSMLVIQLYYYVEPAKWQPLVPPPTISVKGEGQTRRWLMIPCLPGGDSNHDIIRCRNLPLIFAHDYTTVSSF